jgi:uncharacterized protein YodC (DUF2158 family)
MKQGDVVQLKSGGPLMTVQEVKPTAILCSWFDDKHNLKNAAFPEAMLDLYEGPQFG